MLFAAMGFPAAAAASSCGTSYVVKRGDTLSAIARLCGTSVAALRLANPGLGKYIYPGQTLMLPGAYWDNGNGYSTYIVARGDTLRALASRFGTTMDTLASLNGIKNYNLIYQGQRLTVPNAGAPPPPSSPPSGGQAYTVQRGDTLRKIAARYGVTVNDILALNPQIKNANLIYVGQILRLPAPASYYTIQPGDTLRKIAARFGSSVDALLALNPHIKNPNLIYAGQILRVR